MAKNKTTYEIELKADLDDLLSELGTAQKKLFTLLSSNNAPKGLEKAFEKVKDLLGQLSDKASRPMDAGGFKRAKADLDKVAEGLNSITRIVGDFANLADSVKISFLPEGEKQKIEEATKAMEKYLGLVNAANAKEKDLKSAEKTKTKAEDRLKNTEDKISNINSKKAKKTADLEGKKGILAAADVEGANPEKIARYRAEIIALEADLKDLDTQLDTANRELDQAQSEYDQASRVVKALSGEIKGLESKKLKELKDQAVKMGISLEGISGKKTATQIELLTQIIEKNKNQIMNGAEPAYNEWKDTMNKTGESVDKLGDKLESGAEAQKGLEEATSQSEAFEQKIKQFLGLSGAAQLMRHALRDAITTVKELDAAMTEMAVVTDLSVGDYWDQLPEYTNRANELGVSITSVYEASTLYYQQGLKANEVTELSTETLKMAKIAGLDAAEATDRMTAALRGFNMELNETNAQKVADVYSELAAITASDVDEISTAMTKTASIAASAGMEFETTAAFLSQIIETTRESAETAGTAMKTVIARFQELKKAPDEIGEVDGEIVDANAIETALRSVGVSLREAGGQFRELDEVFLELSGKWQSLDKNTQRYIATIAAGSRQQSRFIAMMSDYARTQELVTAANNSAGASQKQFEKTMDSLESKLEKLSNAWHEFTMGILDSELVKTGVDILTKFLEIVNKATSAFDGMFGSMTKIASILTIFKLGSKIFEKLKPSITATFNWIATHAGLKGYEAGKNFAKQAEKGAQEVLSQERSKAEGDKKEQEKEKTKTAKNRREENIKVAISGKTSKEIRSEEKNNKDLKKQDKKRLREVNEEIGDKEAIIALADGTESKEIEDEKQELQKLLNEKSELETRTGSNKNQHKIASFLGFGEAAESRDKASESKNQAKQVVQDIQDANQKEQDLKSSIENRQNEKEALQPRIVELSQSESDRQIKIESLERQANFRPEKFSKEQDEILQKLVKEQNELNNLRKEEGNINQKIEKDQKELEKTIESKTDLETELNKKTQEYSENQQKMWSDIGAGISSAGEKVAGFGVAASMLGGILQEAGLEEFGEWLSKVGQFATIAGTAITTLGPIITMLGNNITMSGHKLVLMGGKVQLAWWWVVLIVAAVAALVVGIIAIVNAVKNSSPEAKLERAQEAAENAAAAADEAAESYNKLASSLDSLDGKYKALEDLTRGTKEWNEAVQDINSSVLDLIDEYPELAKFVEKKEGVLTIDVNSDGVQQVLDDAYTRKITTKNESIMANVAVAERKNEVDYQTIGDYNRNAYSEYFAEQFSNGEIKDEEEAKKAVKKYYKEQYGIIDTSVYEESFTQQAKQLMKNSEELRKYGDSLAAIKTQQQAAYEAIATSAQSLANTLDMSEEEIRRSSNVVDGDLVEQFYEEEVERINSELGLNSNTDMKYFNDKDEVKKAIEATYGPGAKLDDSGKVTYQKGDENKEVTLTQDQIISMVATQEATKSAATAIEMSDDAVAAAGSVIGNEAINNLYNGDSGAALTRTDKDTLLQAIGGQSFVKEWSEKTDSEKEAYKNDSTEFSQEVQDAWQAIVDSGGAISYGDDITKFVDDLVKGVEIASESFDKADTIIKHIEKTSEKLLKLDRSFMNADMDSAFTQKIKDVFDKSGTEGAEQVVDVFNEALAGKTKEEKQKITELLNSYSWSTIESLDKMQLQLVGSGEATWDVAKKLVDTIKIQNSAIDSLATTINVFGDTYQSLQAIGEAQEKITELQWQYNRALEGGSEAIGNRLEQLSEQYTKLYEESVQGYANASRDLAAVYGQGASIQGLENINLLDLVSFKKDEKDNIVGIDTTKLKENSSLWQNEKVQNWISSMEKELSNMKDFKKTGKDAIDGLEELKTQNQDSTIELKNQIKDTILSSIQEQIDTEKEILDATKNANSQLINKLQEQIDFNRQQKQNEKAEQNISDLYSQLAYLQMDTASGASSLQANELTKSIEQSEEEYQNTLIDQSIQALQDSNIRAEKQRERQITLQEQALENYSTSEQLQADINSRLEELLGAEDAFQTEFGKKMFANATLGLSDEERNDWRLSMAAMIAQSKDVSVKDALSVLGTEEDFTVKADTVEQLGEVASEKSRRGKLAQAGFTKVGEQNASGGYTVKTEDLGTLEKLINEDQVTDVSSKLSRIQDAANEGAYSGKVYTSAAEYYSNVYDGTNADSLQSYSDWVTNTEKSIGLFGEEKVKADREKMKGMVVPIATTRKDFYDSKSDLGKKAGHEFYSMDINEGNFAKGASGWMHDTIFYPRGSTLTFSDTEGEQYQASHKDFEGQFVYDRNNGGELYYADNNGWWGTSDPTHGSQNQKNSYNELQAALKHNYKYKTGGLADFTGPAWLDGTKSRPEYVLNADQTKRFFSLVDVLEGYDSSSKNSKPSGDNYFEIEINVEKLENDYDVEQVANKIRSMIYEDATYRNVNAINHIR